MDLTLNYSDVYKNESLGNFDLKIRSWPRNRFEASVFFAGTGNRVLDVGCGNGIVLYNLRSNFKQLHGIELSEERVLTAQKSLHGLNASIIQANIETGINYDDEYFDVIICSDVIEHFVDVFAGFKEVTRLLKKDGKLIINTPNIAEIRRRITLLFGKFPATAAENEGFNTRTELELFDCGHLHYFTYSMLEKMFQRYKYSKTIKYGFGKLGGFHNICPSLLSANCQIIGIK